MYQGLGLGSVVMIGALVLSGCGGKSTQAPQGSPTAPTRTVTSVVVSGTAPGIGDTAQFTATATLSDGRTQDVTATASWQSSNTTVATVSNRGVVTGIGPGEGDIVATYEQVRGSLHLVLGPRLFTLSGLVTDAVTGQPIPGAEVEVLTGEDAGRKSPSADTDGRYAIAGLHPGSFTIRTRATGYFSSDGNVTISDANVRFDVTLRRSFTLSGVVTNAATGILIQGAEAEVLNGEDAGRTARADNSGMYALTGLHAGSFTIRFKANGYESGTHAVTITNADVRVDFALRPCTFVVSNTNVTVSSGGGTATITVTTGATCNWTATSNAAFITITSGANGTGNGTVTFSVTANSGAARSGTLTIAGQTVTVTQAAPAQQVLTAVYDPTLKAPVCNDVGIECTSGTLLNGSGPSEPNQPNTIANSCSDGSGHTAVVDSIRIRTADSTPLAPGKPVLIEASIRLTVPVARIRLYLAADALNPFWSGAGDFDVEARLSGTRITLAGTDYWPAGGGRLRAMRVSFSGTNQFGSGPCAVGSGDDNDDLVFRVQ